jgi:hypothetical protein
VAPHRATPGAVGGEAAGGSGGVRATPNWFYGA